MDLIRLYAQFTQGEAEKTWASPSQEVLADLIDGRWGKPCGYFRHRQKILKRLKRFF